MEPENFRLFSMSKRFFYDQEHVLMKTFKDF